MMPERSKRAPVRSVSASEASLRSTRLTLVLTAAAFAAATVLPILVAPRGLPNAVAGPPAVKPYGGEVVVGEDQEPPTLNRFVPGGDNFIVSKIGQAYWCGVQDIDGHTLELIPDVVTHLPSVATGGFQVNADGTMTVRYTIRDEAVWADGVPVSGHDFAFTYQTIMRPDVPTDKTIYQDIIPSSVKAGPKTFEYTLLAPTRQAELLFGVILPKHEVEGADFVNDYNDRMWMSCGPFAFDSWDKGHSLTVVRNDRYWKRDSETSQALPYLDRVVFRFIPETESLVNAFQARELDIINPPPSAELIGDLKALEDQGAFVDVEPGPVWEHLNFSFSPARLERNPNSSNENLNYRKAVAHAINKRLIVDEILAGQVEALDSFVDAFSPTLSQGAWSQYFYDPAKARELLEQAKAELGVDEISTVFSTTSNNDARVLLSQLFVDMFEAVGIVYTNQLEDSQIFFGETLDNGKWDLGEWAWLGAPGLSGLVDIMDIFDPEAPPPDGSNFYRWGTPGSSVIDNHSRRFAELRDLMNSTIDEPTLIRYVHEAEDILADQVVIIPLYARLVVGAVWADEVGGFKLNPTQAGYTWNIEEWYRLPAGETVTGAVSAGGSLTTDTESDGATATDPIETTVTSPNAGTVTIRESSTAVPDPPGFSFLQFRVDITAPPATAADPLQLVLRVDASAIPAGDDHTTLTPTKDGMPIDACTDSSAVPDPCLAASSRLGDGDLQFTIRTSGASAWRIGKELPVRHSVGLVDPSQGRWYLRDGTPPFYYGNPNDIPFMGDWDCDGIDTPGLFRQSDAFAYLRDSNTQGIADIRFFFGNPDDIPLAGDFNGDGCDTLSLYRPSEQRFYIINKLGENEGGLGAAEFSFLFGNPGDKPVVGDWDGDGIDEVGLHRESTGFFYFRNTLDTGIADGQFFFGDPGDRFVAGDWGIIDRVDTPAIFRPSDAKFYFRHTNTQGIADEVFRLGEGTWLPVAGVFGP